MRKTNSIRAHLTRWLPELKAHPDRLHIFVEGGQIMARQSETPSYAFAYTLKVGFWDFAGDANTVMVPILAWIEREQPQLLRRADSQPFVFEAELQDSDTYDLLISIEVTEAVLVLQRTDGSGYDVTHPPEPDFTDAFDGVGSPGRLWQGFAGPDLMVETTDPAAILTPAVPPAA